MKTAVVASPTSQRVATTAGAPAARKEPARETRAPPPSPSAPRAAAPGRRPARRPGGRPPRGRPGGREGAGQRNRGSAVLPCGPQGGAAGREHRQPRVPLETGDLPAVQPAVALPPGG